MKALYVFVGILFFWINSSAQMAGNYIIGASGAADFATFSAAVSYMSTEGVSAPIVFNVENGIYNEQVVISQITGASATNTITFQSQSLDATLVTLKNDNATSTNNYVLQLNGADYLIFDKLTIMASNASYGRVINMIAASSYNTFQNCRIQGISTTGYYDTFSLVYTNNTTDEYNTFQNNVFTNGSYGIKLKGYSSMGLSSGNIITNNQFVDQNYYGIYVVNQDAIEISDNTFDLNNTDAIGIYMEYCDKNINVSNNVINISTGIYGIQFYYCDGNISQKGSVVNNAIWLGGSISTANGMLIEGSSYQNIYHNSVHLSASSSTVSTFRATGGSNLDVRNNIFSSIGSGFAIYTSGSSIFSTCDYNNYYSTGNFMAYWGTNVTDLATLQSTNAMDVHSLSVNPVFASISDLHTSTFRLNNIADPSVSVAFDIDGEPRSVTPDMGCDEFTGVGSPLNGTYEIGGVSADFQTIYSAVDSLNEVGVSGLVIFNINSGSYNEQFKIYNIAGASSANTITFQSTTANPNNVDISFLAGSSNNYIVSLASSDYITFKNLMFTTSDPTYSTIFKFTGNATNDSIVACILNGVYGSNDGNHIIYSSGEYFKNIVVKGNTFYNGKAAIHLTGSSLYRSSGIEIANNTISDCYHDAVTLQYCDNSIVSGNTISNSLSIYFYGIFLQYCNEKNQVLKNNISSTLPNGGIYLKNCTGTVSKKSLIANNYIKIGGSSYAYGIRTYTTTNVDIYYNTVNIESSHTTYGAAYKNESGSNIRIKNNIFVNMGDGYAIENSLSTAVTESDYNDILTTGNNIAKIDATNRISFADYQAATGTDVNSISVYPGFLSSSDMHTNNPFIDGAGTPLADILDDYDGDIRNLTTPDIGADEFTSTIIPLAGTYTVGGTSPDFATISDAVFALNNYGISDAVTFNIRPGTYNEHVMLYEIPGASETDTILFQSENGDSSSVTILYNSLTTEQNYVFNLYNTDYVTLNKLTLSATGPTYARCIYMNGANHDVNITNCRLLSTNTSTTSILYSSLDNNSNIKIKNNYFHEGEYGIYFEHSEDYYCLGTEIINNDIQSTSYYAIYLENHDSPIIHGNTIHNESGTFYGIVLEDCKNAITITSNKIYCKYDIKGIFLKNCIGSVINPALVANNFVTMGGSSSTVGINLEASDYINVYHNSVWVTSTGTTGKTLYLASGTNYRIKNNIFANTGAGYAIYVASSVGILECDYNNLYAATSNFGYLGATINSFANWQTTSTFDANSISVESKFYSETDLHTSQALFDEAGIGVSEVTTDIDGVTRDASTPDIGAQEFYCETPIFDVVFSTTCLGDSTIITDASTNVTIAATYKWDFDNDFSEDYVSTIPNESFKHLFDSEGNHTINLIINQLGGCVDFEPFVLNVNSMPELSITTEGAYCDSANGTASVSVTVGSEPFTYAWSTGETTSGIENLLQGEYNVAVIDANGCATSEIVEVGNAITVTLTQLSGSTCGANDGIASATVTGGIEPYYYLWSNGITTQIDSSLSPGTHFVNVIDNNGCGLLSFINIANTGSGPAITTLSVTNNTCYGESSGAIDILVTGGVTPYTYLWSNGETTQDISNLYKGVYQLTVTDADSCIVVKDFTVTGPSAIIVNSIIENASCSGSDGVAVVAVTGGTAPYIYAWESGNTNSIESNLSAGIYSVTVTDAYNCQKVEPIIINNVGAPTISIVSVIGATCTSSNSGAINIGISGGTPLYTYLWSSGQTTQDISGLSVGTYTVTATDNDGCSAAETITISEALPTTPQICMLTVDTTNGKNLIIWEKSVGEGIASYNIYKESNQSGVYYLIGNVLYNEMSVFTDLYADPEVRSWRYKISAVDSCGNETEKSFMHKTMHLTVNLGVSNTINLIWDHYQGFEFSSYEIQRYSPSAGLEIIDTIPNNIFTYTDLTPPADASYYQVAAMKPSVCNVNTGNKTQQGPYSQSISNLDDTGIIEHSCEEVFETPTIIGDILVTPGGQESYTVNDVNDYTYTWTVDGGTILSGQNVDSIVVIWGVAGVGAISVIAEDEFGCQGTTSEIDITINVNEIDISDQILVYPNPNSGEFSILVSFADLQQTQITISDVTGK
ncbi:MAG: hypothetical protein A2236_00015, partial [Bacteroidetes bacterium RIFOXYA2_FULL_33_7]